MKVNCLSCGHSVYVDSSYDDYEGQIKCLTCHALLDIKTNQGNIKSVKFIKIVPRPTTGNIGKAAEHVL